MDARKIAATLATKKSKQANFVKPLPVYIVYFSAAALTDGTIIDYQDLYKRDTKVIAALLDRDGKPAAAQASAARRPRATLGPGARRTRKGRPPAWEGRLFLCPIYSAQALSLSA